MRAAIIYASKSPGWRVAGDLSLSGVVLAPQQETYARTQTAVIDAYRVHICRYLLRIGRRATLAIQPWRAVSLAESFSASRDASPVRRRGGEPEPATSLPRCTKVLRVSPCLETDTNASTPAYDHSGPAWSYRPFAQRPVPPLRDSPFTTLRTGWGHGQQRRRVRLGLRRTYRPPFFRACA